MPLYAFGSNGSGQLAIGHDEDTSVPAKCLFEDDTNKIELPNPPSSFSSSEITRIVAGGNHTLVLLANGSVFSTGCNDDGRCGHAPSSPLKRFRRVVLRDRDGRVFSRFGGVAATWEASVLVAEDGEGDKVFS
ncbi:hypothetical protein BO71DRAFT_489381, partial [Aspergillus ellipticus CBS 707.79]